MIGGGGEQKTLQLVARYADACSLFAYERRWRRSRAQARRATRHCEREGRPYEAIEKERQAPGYRDAGRCSRPPQPARELGITHTSSA